MPVEDKGQMTDKIPKISIGMPVYNGGDFMRDAIDSVLAQSFEDFELVISDNASTDNTEAICREYAAKDPRVKYFRSDTNIGASGNFNRAFHLSSGEYFRWAAHDDLLHPDFLVEGMRVLEREKSVVLCYANTARIDENGHITGDYPSDNRKVFDSGKVAERFREVIDMRHWNMVFYGLIRSETLRKTRLLEGYVGSDRTLTAELSLLGRLYRIPKPLFFRREHAEASTQKIKVPQERYSWFESGKTGRICFPNWRYGVEFIRAVGRSPLQRADRYACYGQIMVWYRKVAGLLFKDLKYAMWQLMQRFAAGRTMLRIRRKIFSSL